MKRQKKSFPARAGGALVAALLGAAALVSPATAAFAAPTLEDGDTVYVGPVDWVSGSGFTFPIYAETPADPGNPGEPDFWAYCIEHSESYQHSREALIGGLDSFLGDNHFPNPEVQGKVLWVLAHSYPALSLEALGAAAGVSDLSREDAITATQTAIWRYTDLTWDASWDWGSEDAETVYWHLVNSANASSGLSPADFETSVSITAPGGVQSAGSLVGPFVVTTNQPTVSVSVDPAISLTDADGVPIDPATVVDGQEIYLDLTGETAAGSATLTASATGSSSTGKVISVPTTPGARPRSTTTRRLSSSWHRAQRRRMPQRTSAGARCSRRFR
ncbi:thioester domain-containing protein [Microbacterium sp. NIBRBAC000506063]|uniref:thioester domain-containing protein n=1 Tax=Microbacterium sp. NIBRBAC000506063 TaxID=2734618 RepID=UPI001BB4CB84|nr:thioester domain-containing protein [Microbacterium sp. NIBRBAC000506063]QTV80081.1 thioester domain-containing protein [Microbacterium sp. NIBRBAC000506063]